MVLGSIPVAVTSPSNFAPASRKEFLNIQAIIECGFTLKWVRDMTRTYSGVIGKRNSLLSTDMKYQFNKIFPLLIKSVADALVPVTADMDIKVW